MRLDLETLSLDLSDADIDVLGSRLGDYRDGDEKAREEVMIWAREELKKTWPEDVEFDVSVVKAVS